MSESDQEWQRRLATAALAAGKDIPQSWRFEYDDGADGCMPSGWYAIGLDATGGAITWPIRHEYGPYRTKAEAVGIKILTGDARSRRIKPP